jgi:NAD+ synthase
LQEYLRSADLQAYVLGISGGVDSLAAALLAKKAVLDLRSSSYPAQFVAVRLPYGVRADENDAQSALDVIQPDRVLASNALNFGRTCAVKISVRVVE